MAEIRSFPWLRHLRSEPSRHVLRYRKGQLAQSGRGLAFWFLPMAASVAEVPLDDHELHFLFHGRSSDFQDVTVQGVITWRVVDAERVGERVDFSIDLKRGTWTKDPVEQIEGLLTGMAQQLASRHLAERSVRELLTEPSDLVQERVARIVGHEALPGLGLEVVAVRVADVSPTPELEKALQTPTREALQQQADEATFQRRALAVEKERAIAENELKNQIELARRESELIEQRGANARQSAEEEAEARRIAAEAQAKRSELESGSKALQVREVEGARNAIEREKMAIYEDLPQHVLWGLAAQELAGSLEKIEHLNVSPELLGPLLGNLVNAGTRRLEG